MKTRCFRTCFHCSSHQKQLTQTNHLSHTSLMSAEFKDKKNKYVKKISVFPSVRSYAGGFMRVWKFPPARARANLFVSCVCMRSHTPHTYLPLSHNYSRVASAY